MALDMLGNTLEQDGRLHTRDVGCDHSRTVAKNNRLYSAGHGPAYQRSRRRFLKKRRRDSVGATAGAAGGPTSQAAYHGTLNSP